MHVFQLNPLTHSYVWKFFLITLVVISSCKPSSPPDTDERRKLRENLTDTTSQLNPQNQQANPQMLWRLEFNPETRQSEAIRNYELDPDTLTVERIVSTANSAYPQVKIEYVARRQDTIFMRIPVSEHLTQRMGTTGAQEYMVSLTFSLTELPNVRYVSYDMEEGDHMGPGTFSRQSVLY
ncbi:MAG: hypothetical protein AAF587_41385 [Bacteroidota bacterium]